MNEKLMFYVDEIFAPYDGIKSVSELKADLLMDLQERFSELRDEGKDDETAFAMTIDSIGDIEQTINEVANLSRWLSPEMPLKLSATNLNGSDFAGATSNKPKFHASELRGANFAGAQLTGSLFKVSNARGANFTGADLTGSMFEVSNVREASFDGANLTDCTFSVTNLADASFRKSILVRTTLNTSGQGAKFVDSRLTEVKFNKAELGKTVYENCTFEGVEFKHCDLQGNCFDGQTFVGVKFDKSALNDVSFRGATLKNVSFRLPTSVTNKSYLAFKTVIFDGATMDKLTYAALKGLWVVDLSKVTVL